MRHSDSDYIEKDGFLYCNPGSPMRWDCEFCNEVTNSSCPTPFPSSRLLTFHEPDSLYFRSHLLTIRACRSCHAKYVKKDGFECQSCGKWDSPSSWVTEVGEWLAKNRHCHSCDYWLHRVRTIDSPKSCRIGGYQYQIESDDPNPGWGSGHGGRKFMIRFHDGREVVTRNLWSNGRIPERFRDQLPDNAQFVTDPELKPSRWQGYVDLANSPAKRFST